MCMYHTSLVCKMWNVMPSCFWDSWTRFVHKTLCTLCNNWSDIHVPTDRQTDIACVVSHHRYPTDAQSHGSSWLSSICGQVCDPVETVQTWGRWETVHMDSFTSVQTHITTWPFLYKNYLQSFYNLLRLSIVERHLWTEWFEAFTQFNHEPNWCI